MQHNVFLINMCSVLSKMARSCNCLENYKFTIVENNHTNEMEKMESEKEITYFDAFMCVFFGTLPLSEWNQHQKLLLKAVIKRRLTLYDAVIKGCQFSKKMNMAKMK